MTLLARTDHIQEQYTELIRTCEAYEGNDPGHLGFLVGAAYALKWVLGEEDGSEFNTHTGGTNPPRHSERPA